MLQDPCFDSRQPHTRRRKMNVLAAASSYDDIEETDSAKGGGASAVDQESVAFEMEEYDKDEVCKIYKSHILL